jgi:hypothetical protein
VSLSTKPRPEKDLIGLVRSPEPARAAWWKRPETIAAAVILLAAIAVNLIFL